MKTSIKLVVGLMTVACLHSALAGDIEVDNALVAGTATINALKMTNSAGDGKVLRSDSVGNATWMSLSNVAPVIASVRNLSITNGTDSNNVVVIAADEIVLKNSSKIPLLVSDVSLNLGFTNSVGSVNGLDAGVQTNNTWYYIWIISDGTNVGSVFSTSLTAPTLTNATLSPYVYNALVGAAYNNSSSNLVQMVQRDRRVGVEPQSVFANGTNKLTGGVGTTNLTSSQQINFAKIVPPLATGIWGRMGRTPDGTGVTTLSCSVRPDASSVGYCSFTMPVPDTYNFAYAAFSIPLKYTGANRTFWYNVAGAANETWRIDIAGYEF